MRLMPAGCGAMGVTNHTQTDTQTTPPALLTHAPITNQKVDDKTKPKNPNPIIIETQPSNAIRSVLAWEKQYKTKTHAANKNTNTGDETNRLESARWRIFDFGAGNFMITAVAISHPRLNNRWTYIRWNTSVRARRQQREREREREREKEREKKK